MGPAGLWVHNIMVKPAEAPTWNPRYLHTVALQIGECFEIAAATAMLHRNTIGGSLRL